ncbi:ATP-binding cassette sub-family G member 1-like protein [Dinothrombium tinctorium]|uniref:ATP-binding cassette sub-family G member 1-like protein n=1 Tax=Dinothrombium tinctorium TaxID=1965070 RepID=A0A3S3RRX7_9ACAR|nr:ATP-binding cassette sub-family G member 1-like protein [Dinothrombium tinctorium]RWS03849.1 ATP-binding cassette sub-family G member 1-like protein [Dinothrombium tinctorium]
MDIKYSIFWTNIRYVVKGSWIDRKLGRKEKEILKSVSGRLNSGQLTAIMGPSGAGKSTLLEILVGIRRNGVHGCIMYEGRKEKLDIAFIPQNDTYLDVFTVNETLLFASRVRFATKLNNDEYFSKSLLIGEENDDINDGKLYHMNVIKNVLNIIGLEHVQDTLVKNLSGGQKKRLSIAQELVSQPDLLVLDEPTSGLDSTAAFKCMQLLKNLTEQRLPLTVLCTIHQPNPKTFNLFDKVYVLSNQGKCVYEGSPQHLTERLLMIGAQCPKFYNPADYIIEVAAGEHGTEIIENLIEFHKTETMVTIPIDSHLATLDSVKIKPNFPFVTHFIHLFLRSCALYFRNRLLLSLRLFTFLFSAFFLAYLFGSRVGTASGCPVLDGTLSPEMAEKAMKAGIAEAKAVADNMALLFVSVFLLIGGALFTTTIAVIDELRAFVKQRRNNWYGLWSFHFGMLLSDLPNQIIFPTIYIVIVYVLTNQAPEWWRFSNFLNIFLLLVSIAYSLGMIAGTVFMENIVAAIFCGPILIIIAALFSGLVVRIEIMPKVLRYISKLNFLRYAVEGIIITIYGYERCDKDVETKVTSMKQMLMGLIANILTIVDRELNGESDYENNDYDKSLIANITSSRESYVKDMSDAVVRAIMAGAGAGREDENGKPISRITGFFGVDDNDLHYCILMLIVNVVVYKVLAFIIMQKRCKHV